ncbi:hypothetical protein PIB30_084780 [Stylosanthes scabra]|uniref:Aminotransferase-like plant mobile domain-containing protein n=1 Tax=Stylosanthes scabra TaxID=79078 RepID=A0ABU6ZRA8_9FABA|nr:hypothetical protein [Stylosanthes scabra]
MTEEQSAMVADAAATVMYCLDRVAYVSHNVNVESYLDMVGLLPLAQLNQHWFKMDKPLVSTFVERWRLETYTFHMPWGSTPSHSRTLRISLVFSWTGSSRSICSVLGDQLWSGLRSYLDNIGLIQS